MNSIQYHDWHFLVDQELTYKTYARTELGSADSCPCNDCKNFANYRAYTYPNEIMDLFHKFEIDLKKESEVSHFTKLENGLHYYSGWFHFKGEIISGKDCSIPLPNGGSTSDLTEITKNFSIGFTSASSLAIFEDKKGLVQVEFEAKIPWVIDPQLESE